MQNLSLKRLSNTQRAITMEAKKLTLLQRIHDIKPLCPKESTSNPSILDHFPLFAALLGRFQSAGGMISRIIKFSGDTSEAPEIAENVFGYIGFGLTALNFLRDFVATPLKALATILSGKKLILKNKEIAKFLYSALTLSFAITSLILPATGAILGLVGSVIGLSVSVFFLYRTLTKYHQTQKILHQVQQDIERLRAQLIETVNKEGTLNESLLKRLQAHVNQQALLEKKKHGYTNQKILDRSIGTMLASLAVIGLALNFVFPPAGLIILSIVTFTGFAYTLYRITPKVVSFFNQKFGPSNPHDTTPTDKILVSNTILTEPKPMATRKEHPKKPLAFFDKRTSQGASSTQKQAAFSDHLLSTQIASSLYDLTD